MYIKKFDLTCWGYYSISFLFNPISKALSKRTRKSTQVLDLRSIWVSFGHPLASTCDNLRGFALILVAAQIWTQVDKSFLPFGHPAPVDTKRNNQWYAWNLRFLRLASRLANPFGHPSQVRTHVLVLQTCVDLRVRLARASNLDRETWHLKC